MVWGLYANPLARVEKHPMRASGDIQVFSQGGCLTLRGRSRDFPDAIEPAGRHSPTQGAGH